MFFAEWERESRSEDEDDDERIVFPSSKEQKGLIRNEGERGACKTVNRPSCGDKCTPTHVEKKQSLEKGRVGSVLVATGDVFSVGYKIFPATRVTAIRFRMGRRLFLETSSPEKLGSSRN